MNKRVLFITHAAVIAALYVVLTYLANILGLASGAIQIRFSEALTVFPFFTPAAIPGLFLGCLIANILTGAIIWDVIFGSLASLLGAVGTWVLSKILRGKKISAWLAPVPAIVSNTLIIPYVLQYAYQIPDGIPYLMLTVGAGEVISCGILGLLLLTVLQKYKKYIFP